MPKEESQSDDKKGKKKGKKGKHAEEEEKEVVVYPNPFDELGPSWLKRRDFLATMASQREYLDNVEPKTESAHVLRAERDRRPSLPDRLEAPVSDALGTCLGGDPDDDPLHGAKGVATPEIDHFLPMKLYKEPSLTRERRLSNIVSRSEQTARELRAILTERAELEKGDEATIQSKLSFWDAGHEQYKLDMTGKTLMKDDFYFLCYALRFNYMIKSLDLSKCFVTDRDMIDICENMEMNRCTDELSLRQTKVGDDGAHALLKLFKLNNTLTRLDMRQTSLTGDGGQMLVEACTINRNLTMLNGLDLPDLRAHPPDVADFSEHYFGAPDVVILHDLFAGQTNIHTLNLRKNRLGPKSAPYLVKLLTELPRLTELNLAANRIGSQGCEALAGFFANNTTVTDLDISVNGAMLRLPEKEEDTTGLLALADAFKPGVNKTVVHLKFDGDYSAQNPEVAPDVARWINERITTNRAVYQSPILGDPNEVFQKYVESLVHPPRLPSEMGTDLSLQCDINFLKQEGHYIPPEEVAVMGEFVDSFTIHPATRAKAHKQDKRSVDPSTSRIPKYEQGMDVMSRWKIDGRLYPGSIQMCNPDGTFNVTFNDGTVVSSVPRTDLRPGHRSKETRWDP